MTSTLESVILEAANQLNEVLQRGTSLYTDSLTDLNAPFVKAALGFGQQQQQQSNQRLISCLMDNFSTSHGSVDTIDFPVLVNCTLLPIIKTYYVTDFQTQKQARSAQPNEHQPKYCDKLTDSLDNLPHVTRSMLADKPEPFIALSWLCNPQIDCFINCRRRLLLDGLRAAGEKCSGLDRLQPFVKETVLLDLLLSVSPKLKLLWEYRLWIITHVLSNNLLEKLNSKGSLDLLVARLQRQDDVLFFIAAHNHPMNYNAWHYRRCLNRTLQKFFSKSVQLTRAMDKVVEYDCTRVLGFLREHNGDTSAASYLQFLLHEQSSRDSIRAASASQRLSKSHVGVCQPPEQKTALYGVSLKVASSSASKLWKNLMAFTQEEIRRHCEKGHESLWYLRLELVRWALKQTSQRNLCSLWTVEDELEWVSVYVDAVSNPSEDHLLAPVSAIPHAWTDSFGSLAWTSYIAARYGLQLLSILSVKFCEVGAK